MIVAQRGGDEFIVLLPRAPESAARAAGERIRRHVTDAVIIANGHPVGISVSMGLPTNPVAADRGGEPVAQCRAGHSTRANAQAATDFFHSS